jgi:two-component system LytT family response regulator
MMRCIAIDDEPLALELLTDNISKVPFLQLVAACDNALEAMAIMEQQPVDLIFLDIQMPGLTGLQFIQSMTVKPMIILITAYEKYALQGFDLNVTDYLVKPVSLDRFVNACNKARELFQLRAQPKIAKGAGYFFVNVDYSLVKVITADIIYIEGLKDYIKIHLKSTQRPIVTRMPMKTIEELLSPESFIRIHKSYIVSIAFITSVRKSSVFIDSLELPVSDNYRDAIAVLTGKL